MLSVDLHTRRGKFDLHARFDLPADAGVLGIVGASGSGKTTLLESIAGIVTPISGRIQLNRHTWLDTTNKTNLDLCHRKIGYVFQDDLLFEHLSVRRNLLYGAVDDAALDEITHALAIAPYLDRMPTELSGGQRRRVALGRALLREPEVVLLDEPLTGLDAATAHSVLLYLRTLLRDVGKPAIYVSHSLSEVNFICDRALGLVNGEIVYDGDPLSAVTASGCVQDRALSELRNVYAVQSAEHTERARGLELYIAPRQPQQQNEPVIIHALGNDEDALLVRGCVVAARDVVLTMDKPTGVSARNIFAARITSIDEAQQLAVVRLDIGVPMAAEVGYASQAEMKLVPGMELFAMFKASAVGLIK